LRVDGVVLSVRADETDVDDSVRVVDPYYKALSPDGTPLKVMRALRLKLKVAV
jgi:hypothetical protein